LHPFQELLLPVGWKRVEGDHVLVCFHTYPIAPVVEPKNIGPGYVRRRGRDVVVDVWSVDARGWGIP
jgi:hypothetical protein